MTKECILVTGGAGFIGSHTVQALLKLDKQVVVLDNLSSGQLARLPLSHPNLQFVEGDILDSALLANLLPYCQAVLHLAAIASVPFSIAHPLEAYRVNAEGFLCVLDAIRKTAKKIRLVYASSAAVYGNTEILPCTEDHLLPNPPLSPYAMHKIDNERYAHYYARLYGLPSLGLRYFNVYGEGQDPQSPYAGVISRFLSSHQTGQSLKVFGDGQQSRDFVHITDVVMANQLALASDYTGVLNIATGQPETLLQLIRYIELIAQAPVRYTLERARPGDIQSSYASTELASKALGFRSTVSLQEGMRLMMGCEVC